MSKNHVSMDCSTWQILNIVVVWYSGNNMWVNPRNSTDSASIADVVNWRTAVAGPRRYTE